MLSDGLHNHASIRQLLFATPIRDMKLAKDKLIFQWEDERLSFGILQPQTCEESYQVVGERHRNAVMHSTLLLPLCKHTIVYAFPCGQDDKVLHAISNLTMSYGKHVLYAVRRFLVVLGTKMVSCGCAQMMLILCK